MDRVSLKPGTYTSPYATLHIRGGEVVVELGEPPLQITWRFSEEGVFGGLDIATSGNSLSPQGKVVCCCQHIYPGCTGEVYFRDGAWPIASCPQCVKLRGEGFRGRITLIDRQIFNRIIVGLEMIRLE